MKNQIIKLSEYSFFSLIIIYIVNTFSCGWNDPCYRNFGVHTTNIVRIDQAELTRDTLYSTETESVKLWGTIGNNSGYTFKGIEVIRFSNSIDMTVWNSLDIPCGTTTTDTLLQLTGYAYNITPPLTQGANTVIIHQPDGGTITLNYFVRY
jgi:hypothetical protein